MKINEVERRTGITKRNIRFYEKQGLVSPNRNRTNFYRDYNEEDVESLLLVKLLRKLDVPVLDIQLLQTGALSLDELLQSQTARIAQHQQELEISKEVCRKMAKNGETLHTLRPAQYLAQIEALEKQGARFTDILKDFIGKSTAKLPHSKLYFEPEEPILTREEFTLELLRYGQREGKEVTVEREGMAPVVWVEGKRYIAQLETPRWLHFPFSIFYVGHTYGFRWVYLYKHPHPQHFQSPNEKPAGAL